MQYLVDTNVLLRLVSRSDALCPVAHHALLTLHQRADELCYTSQVLAEFWSACTRPSTARGGLGLTAEQAERRVRLIEKHLTHLRDDVGVHPEWRKLIHAHAVLGRQVHDARLAAAMNVHRLTHILTFNGGDFVRYGVTVVDPRNV